jgi:photosystem II stability/assembly factor-like uncharacterized protein
MRKLTLLFLIAIPFVLLVHAADYDASLFGSLHWRNIGPQRGGRSIASSGSVQRPNEYYFGAVGGGLWKTTDGGLTWRAVTDGQLKSSSIGAVAVAASNPDIVYIGMGETELRGNIMQGDGVYRSEDAGKTWKNIGLADTQAIARVRVHPTNPDIVFVAAFGHPYGPNEERGVFRTTDGGKTWKKVLYRNDHSGAVDLCFDPANPRVLFAAIWDAFRTPWSLSSGGPGSGLFKSTDGGDTWKEITRNSGMPQGIIGKIGVSVSGGDSKRVYAMVEAEDGGMFRSDDGGEKWERISEDRRIRQRAFYYTRVYADPKDKDTVYVLNTGMYRSTDGGKTYRAIRAPHGDHHDLWIAPDNPKRMINSNDGGGNVSINGGESWTGQRYPTAQLYHVAVTKDIPYHVCGAQQDNSTVCVPGGEPRGRGGQGGGDIMYAVAGGESGYIAPDPRNPDIFYAGSQGALLTRFDRHTGHTRDVQVYPLFFSGQSAGSLKERWQWTFPIVFSPLDPKVLYTSSQHLWKTTDEGHSWTRISPDLTRGDPKTLGDSGGPITKDQNGPEIYGTIFTIAPSRQDPLTIWTGSDDGVLFITRDGGKNWKKITPAALPEFSRVTMIDASPHKPGTAYVAAKRYQLDDRRPYIFKTPDYGQTWYPIVTGIADNDFAQVVREDPKRAGLLFAGTEHGIYVSFDDGAHWQSLRLDLPDTQVSDLLIERDDLVIATHGRSFYVLDDITVLRQLTPELAASNVHLFKPRPAVRGLNQASIDYYLKTSPDKLTIEILDAAGKTVRTFPGSAEEENRGRGGAGAGGRAGRGGAEAATGAEPDTGGGEEEGFGPPRQRPPARKAGVNRFTWDLRYPGATVFEGMILWSARAEQGPSAVPGRYQVRLKVGDQTETQPLIIEIDPRLKGVTQADLVAQFQLASQVRDKTSAADEIVILVRDIKKQIADRTGKANDAALTSAGEKLAADLSVAEEEVYQVKNRSNQDPLNFPIKLNNMISALFRTVEAGDGAPTVQSYEVFKELSGRLAKVQAQLDGVLKTELSAFNLNLAAHKLDAIKAEKKTQTN